MKKYVAAILLVISVLAILLLFHSCRNNETSASTESPTETEHVIAGAYVSRGEWITMLGEKFDLDTYQENTPYYADISAGNPLFPYVQAAAEWEILAIYSQDVLGADQAAGYAEVASTAAIAAGFQLDRNSQFDEKAAIAYAVQRGILEEQGPDYFTPEECNAILEKAYSVYLNDPGEEKTNAVLNENVIDLGGVPLVIEGDRAVLPNDSIQEVTQGTDEQLTVVIDREGGSVELSVGDTFITAPDAENPWGIAYKVIDIQRVDGETVLIIGAPTLDDLYRKLDVHTTVSANPDNIIWADGVLATETGTGSLADHGTNGVGAISLLTYQKELPQIDNLASKSVYNKSWDISIKQGDLEKTREWENAGVLGHGEQAKAFENSNFVYDGTPSIADFNDSKDSWEKKLETKSKFSGGYEITGNVTINAVTVTTDIQYKQWELFDKKFETPIPEAASISLSSDISSSLKLEGVLNEQLKIGTIPIPLSAPGLSVSVDLYLYADANGSLQIKSEFSHVAKVEWREGEKLRKAQDSAADLTAEVAMTLDFGVDLAASLDAYGQKVIDAGVKAGANLTADASVSGKCEERKKDGVTTLNYKESMIVKADLYVPIITLYVGNADSLIKTIGISKSWDIITKDKNAKCIPLIEQEWVFWEETITPGQIEPAAEVSIMPTPAEETPAITDTASELSNAYITQFPTVNMVTLPKFEIDYPAGWTVTEEMVVNAMDGEYSSTEMAVDEKVVLSNDRSATVTYWHFRQSDFNYGRIMRQYEFTKVADSSFVPVSVQAGDYSDLGEFMVAKVQLVGELVMDTDADYTPVDGGVLYAVVPESYAGLHSEVQGSGGIFGETTVEYAILFAVMAEAPGGSFTEQEEKDVISMLSSFRVINLG